MTRLKCPGCGAKFAHDHDKGNQAECPDCGLALKFPESRKATEPSGDAPPIIPAKPDTPAIDPDSPEGWYEDCQRLVFHAALLLRLSKRHIALMAVVDVIQNAPNSLPAYMEIMGQLANAPATAMFSTHPSLFVRLISDANRFDPESRDALVAVMTFWDGFSRMPEARRDLLVASAIGAFMGFLTG